VLHLHVAALLTYALKAETPERCYDLAARHGPTPRHDDDLGVDFGHFEVSDLGSSRRVRGLLKIELDRFSQVREGLFFRRALARDVQIQTLGDVEVTLLGD
jgi:hypothetical protein